MNNTKSIEAFSRAKKRIPGGVNSPVRAFKSVKSDPVFIARGKGAIIEDIDGNRYIDYVGSWGPLILGHAHDRVVEAIKKTAEDGTSYGAPTVYESILAEKICEMVPSIEMVRMVSSGTEATMSAVRLARGYTGREKIIKFAGCYHGHGDSFLIKAGSGAVTLGLPDSPGVTRGTAEGTLIADYNDPDSVEKLFSEHPEEIAAVILEPVAGNMGTVLPAKGFLAFLRKITERNGALLIFDEVITGFRLGKGGAQAYFNVMPDLTTLGKVIGGGLPVGAFGGKKEIMENMAPEGAVYQAGTLSGNPLAMSAGIAMLEVVESETDFYNVLDQKAENLAQGIRENLKKTGVPGVVNRIGSMMTLFFTELETVASFSDAMKSNTDRYASYFKDCLWSGIYIAPSQFECAFLSAAHTEEDIEKTIQANLEALKKMN